MPLSLHVQFNIVLYAFISGIIIGLLFDFYRIIRGIKVPGFIIAVEDILFFILSGIIVFVFLLYTGYAYFGVYVYIFMILSVIIYFKFLSNLIYNFEKRLLFLIIKICRVAVKNIFYPFRFIFYKINSKK